MGNDTNLYRYVGNKTLVMCDNFGLAEYRKGDSMPQIIDDVGSGVHGRLKHTITQEDRNFYKAWKWRVWGAYIWGYRDAARHMQHYLDNTGSDLYIDLERFIREAGGSKGIVKKEIKLAKKFCRNYRWNVFYDLQFPDYGRLCK